jgi:hypothetical protein
MLRLTPARQRVLVAHLPELANVAVGSLLFGQFLTERPYSVALAVVGIAAWFALMGIVFLLPAVNENDVLPRTPWWDYPDPLAHRGVGLAGSPQGSKDPQPGGIALFTNTSLTPDA